MYATCDSLRVTYRYCRLRHAKVRSQHGSGESVADQSDTGGVLYNFRDLSGMIEPLLNQFLTIRRHCRCYLHGISRKVYLQSCIPCECVKMIPRTQEQYLYRGYYNGTTSLQENKLSRERLERLDWCSQQQDCADARSCDVNPSSHALRQKRCFNGRRLPGCVRGACANGACRLENLLAVNNGRRW